MEIINLKTKRQNHKIASWSCAFQVNSTPDKSKRLQSIHSKICLEMQFNWWLWIRENEAYSLYLQLKCSVKSWVHIFCNGAIFFFSLADIGRDSDMFDFRYENPVKSQINHFDFQLNHFHTMLPIYDSASNTAKMNKSTKKISWMQRSELLNSLLWKCTFFSFSTRMH